MTEIQEMAQAIYEKHKALWPLTGAVADFMAKQLAGDQGYIIVNQLTHELMELNNQQTEISTTKHKPHCLLLDPEEPQCHCSCGLEPAPAQDEQQPTAVPEGWLIELGFDVLDRPFRFVDSKSHTPTIKVILPACEPDDSSSWDLRDEIARRIGSVLAAPIAQTEQQPIGYACQADLDWEDEPIRIVRDRFRDWQVPVYAAPIAQTAPRCQCCGYLVTDSEHRGCLRAATLSSVTAERDRLREEVTELDALRDKLSGLLSQTAIALRGPEPELTRYGYADIPLRVKTVIDEIDQLRAEVEGLRKDAERYRWLRDQAPKARGEWEIDGQRYGMMLGADQDDVDQAVDALMSAMAAKEASDEPS